MKKIVGIIAGLALIAGFAFADAPAINVSEYSFSGKASLEWIADLDKETTGMKNHDEASFALKFIKKGDKSSTGDGVWGEIKIEAGDAEAKNGGNVTVPTASVKTATIHFLDDDFYLDMSILKPGLGIGGGDIITATSGKKAFPAAAVTVTDHNGFKLTFGLKDIIDFGLVFVDNGQKIAKEKKFGFVFDATLKAVDGLGLNVAAGYGTEKEKFVASAKVDYKLAIGDMYLKPAVGFALDEAEAKNLSAGLLFGWGADGIKPDFASFSNSVTNVPNECADGVSVYASVPLKDSPAIGFLFSAFDSKFLADFGVKIGAQLAVADLANFGKGSDAFDAAIKWASGDLLGDWKVDANAGIKFIIDGSKFGALYGAGISNSALIDNTKLYLNYKGEHGADVGGANLKGTITLGCEISI